MKNNDSEKWIEIARVGRFRDSSGGRHDFSQARLEKIAAGYDPEKRDAPLVIRHPATNGPAHGWIKKLKVDGKKLLAFPAYVSDSIKNLSVNNINICRYFPKGNNSGCQMIQG